MDDDAFRGEVILTFDGDEQAGKDGAQGIEGPAVRRADYVAVATGRHGPVELRQARAWSRWLDLVAGARRCRVAIAACGRVRHRLGRRPGHPRCSARCRSWPGSRTVPAGTVMPRSWPGGSDGRRVDGGAPGGESAGEAPVGVDRSGPRRERSEPERAGRRHGRPARARTRADQRNAGPKTRTCGGGAQLRQWPVRSTDATAPTTSSPTRSTSRCTRRSSAEGGTASRLGRPELAEDVTSGHPVVDAHAGQRPAVE